MNRLLTSVMVGLAGIQGITLAAESRPKLLVGIIVDQLRTDYLESMKGMLGNGGFRRLMDNGIYLKDIDFEVVAGDPASSAAIIQTGTYPRYNGITASEIYDPQSKGLKPVFTDETYIGNFTSETYSPAALRVTTLTDEVSIEGKGTSKIHVISPDASQSIVLAGHNANSAFWVNDNSGKWASTTYYTLPPATLQNQNYNLPLVSRLDTIKWVPLRKGEPYPFVSSNEIEEGFKYSFPRSDKDVFSLYKQSPFVNRDITRAAVEYITELGLGKNVEATDVLNLGYTLAPFPAANDGDYRYELEDAYLRLDKDLENLFNTLDRYVGKDNVVVYLVSTGYFDEPQTNLPQYRLPGGSFSVKRAMSLLNSFLSAKYGNGAYVENFANNQIYLARPLIEEKGLELNQVAGEARDFMAKMSGVAEALTPSDIANPTIPSQELQRRSIDPKTAGDIILEFTPGWTVVDDSRFPNKTLPQKSTAYLFPGFIMGEGFAPKVIEETVEAVAIAPTISQNLKIRAPNSATAKPLKLK